jgi:pimeloyl-ACP methyl ester carboxylesterase
VNVVCQGLLTHYKIEGPPQAPLILMLHGWGTSAADFDQLATGLSGRLRVLRLDLPGFGGTQTPPPDWHVSDYVDFVHQFLSKLEIHSLDVVLGHSFGGRIALKAIATAQLQPKRLILLDSAGIKPASSLRAQTFRLVAKVGKSSLNLPGLKQFAPSLRRRLYRSANSNDYLSAGQLRPIFLNVIAEDLTSSARQIRIPVLLIWGSLDTDTPLADGEKLAQVMTNSKLMVIEGAGHFVHQDAHDEVLKAIEAFAI